jgi:DNA-binding NarL/FixJ family response regulator
MICECVLERTVDLEQSPRDMRVVIADSEFNVRRALTILLQKQRGAAIAGYAASADDLLSLVARTQPDIILLDNNLPGMMTSRLIYEVRRLSPALKIILLSIRPYEGGDVEVLDVDHFVSKVDGPERFVMAYDQCVQQTRCKNLEGKQKS